MRRLLAIAAVLGAVGLAVLLSGAGKPDKSGVTYYLVFDNAFTLVEGGDLRIGNVNAGKTTKFTVTDDFPVKAVVEAKITYPGFEPFKKDATCAIRQQSLVGEYFVDCQPGSAKEEIPNGGTLPVEQTQSTIPVDLVNNIMRRPYRERFRLILSELGAGLAGRPQDLAEVLQRAHPGFRETSKTLRLLGRQDRIIQDFIVDSDTAVKELEAKKTEVARWIDETGETAAISASRKRQIEANFRSLPPFLDELESYMVRLGQFADAQVPVLQDLRRAAPDLEVTFRELGPFARASRVSLRSLGELGDTGRRAIAESREEVDQLRLFAGDVPRLATPLRQFLQTADDRERSTEEDPRAKEIAPPAPDKTAYKSGQGFTGFEAFLNYFYYQALTLNAFDETSHFLRVLVFISPECSPYETDPEADRREQCEQYLGDYQPGVTDPDPTENGDTEPDEAGGGDTAEEERSEREDNSTARSARLRIERLRRAAAERRRTAASRRRPAPAAPPGAAAPGAPAPQPGAPPQLLDYLMAP